MPTLMRLEGRDHRLRILACAPELVVLLDDARHVVNLSPRPVDGAADGAVRGGDAPHDAIEIDGHRFEFHAANDDTRVHLRWAGRTWRVDLPDPRDAARAQGAASDEIVAEMPGTLVQVVRRPGEDVQAGEVVVTIESMKLQMHLSAPRAGRIARIAVAANQAFDKGATLVVFEPIGEADAQAGAQAGAQGGKA